MWIGFILLTVEARWWTLLNTVMNLHNRLKIDCNLWIYLLS